MRQYGHLVDELLTFDYLGLGETGMALRLFGLYEARKLASRPSIFFLQVYLNLELREQFFKVYDALYVSGQLREFPGRMIIANLCLMFLHEQKKRSSK